MKRTCISESFFFGQTTGLSLSLFFSLFSLLCFSFIDLSLPTTSRLAINNTGSSGVVLIRSRVRAQIRQNFLFYIIYDNAKVDRFVTEKRELSSRVVNDKTTPFFLVSFFVESGVYTYVYPCTGYIHIGIRYTCTRIYVRMDCFCKNTLLCLFFFFLFQSLGFEYF